MRAGGAERTDLVGVALRVLDRDLAGPAAAVAPMITNTRNPVVKLRVRTGGLLVSLPGEALAGRGRWA